MFQVEQEEKTCRLPSGGRRDGWSTARRIDRSTMGPRSRVEVKAKGVLPSEANVQVWVLRLMPEIVVQRQLELRNSEEGRIVGSVPFHSLIPPSRNMPV